MVSDLIFFGALGVIIGGRVGYVLFYGFPSSWPILYGYSRSGLAA